MAECCDSGYKVAPPRTPRVLPNASPSDLHPGDAQFLKMVQEERALSKSSRSRHPVHPLPTQPLFSAYSHQPYPSQIRDSWLAFTDKDGSPYWFNFHSSAISFKAPSTSLELGCTRIQSVSESRSSGVFFPPKTAAQVFRAHIVRLRVRALVMTGTTHSCHNAL